MKKEPYHITFFKASIIQFGLYLVFYIPLFTTGFETFKPDYKVQLIVVAISLVICFIVLRMVNKMGGFMRNFLDKRKQLMKKITCNQNEDRQKNESLYVDSNLTKVVLVNRTNIESSDIIYKLNPSKVITYEDFDDLLRMNCSDDRTPYVSSCLSEKPMLDMGFERYRHLLYVEEFEHVTDTRMGLKELLDEHVDVYIFAYALVDDADDKVFIKSCLVFTIIDDKRIEIDDIYVSPMSKTGNRHYNKALEFLMEDLIKFCYETGMKTISYESSPKDKEAAVYRDMMNRLIFGKFERVSEDYVAFL